MDRSLKSLQAAGIAFYESSFTALDAYHGVRTAPDRFGIALASLVELAKASEGLEYPGLPFADLALPLDSGGRFYFRSVDTFAESAVSRFAPLDLLRDPQSRVFHDPGGIYPSLRERRLAPRPGPAGDSHFEAAVLLSRYDYDLSENFSGQFPALFPLESQRVLLSLILSGKSPERGLEYLRKTGFLAAFWPELAELSGVGQSKEYHPEGDAWEHTLETFRYRKFPDFRLSLALLLHDAGKPQAQSAEGRRFDRHAEIGGAVAERFLRRLGFPSSLVGDVSFLIRFHMLPAALPRLPVDRSREALEDPRFPLLLELYKCDELSTFRGPEGYYEACAAYKAYLKNVKNPYRDEEGRKLARLYIEEGIRPRPPSAPRRRA